VLGLGLGLVSAVRPVTVWLIRDGANAVALLWKELWPAAASRRQRLIGRRWRGGRQCVRQYRPSVVVVVVVARATTAPRSILQRLIGHQTPADKHRGRRRSSPPSRGVSTPRTGHARWTRSSSAALTKRDVDCSTTNAPLALSRRRAALLRVIRRRDRCSGD